MFKRGGYRNGFMQRFGMYDDNVIEAIRKESRVWVHAVSVGEVFVALRFMEEIRKSNPSGSFIITVTTSTGYDVARSRKSDQDILLYFPLDFPLVIKRVLNVLNPAALILTESEIWPNLIRQASNRGIPVIIINGRVSDSSYRGYRMLGVISRRVLTMIKLFLVQTQADMDRLVSLGADSAKIHVVGSSKYDGAVRDPGGEAKAGLILESCGMNSLNYIIVGGSTWPGEEDILAGIYKRLVADFDSLKLVLVPRHAERRAEVEADIAKHGLKCVKRSEMGTNFQDNVDVLLVDTTGELKNYYAFAAVIFVGKSLTSHGGQNFIEPALFGKPVLTGFNLENFPVVADDFIEANAIIRVADEAQLEKEIRHLLSDGVSRAEFGERARRVVEGRLGVVEKSIGLIQSIIPSAN